MEKGLLIFICLLGSIALLNIAALRLINIPQEKKAPIRKVFWYFYGIIYFINGLIRVTGNEELKMIHCLELIIGITVFVSIFLGKIRNKKPHFKSEVNIVGAEGFEPSFIIYTHKYSSTIKTGPYRFINIVMTAHNFPLILITFGK